MKIVTSPTSGPREQQYCAHGAEYDGATDSRHSIGYGPTRAAAVEDYLSQVCRERTGWVDFDGSCLSCGAVSGEVCLARWKKES